MQVRLTVDNGNEFRMDLPGYSPRNAELLGEWLMQIFSQMQLSPAMPRHYRIEVY